MPSFGLGTVAVEKINYYRLFRSGTACKLLTGKVTFKEYIQNIIIPLSTHAVPDRNSLSFYYILLTFRS